MAKKTAGKAKKSTPTEAAEQPSATPPASVAGATGETVTKAEAVRRAIADGADKPTDGVAYIKERFGLDVTPAVFSAYKTTERKKESDGAASGGRKQRASAADGGAVGSGDVVDFARQVKALVEQFGAAEVQAMVGVFKG